MFGSECELIMHFQDVGYTLPLKMGAQKLHFSTISQHNSNITATLTAYIFRTKQKYIIMRWKL